MSITQIPYPGGSGITPTGAIQFQDDWPGLFIRGDDAIFLSQAIRRIQEFQQTRQEFDLAIPLMRLERIADIIDNEVIVRAPDSQ